MLRRLRRRGGGEFISEGGTFVATGTPEDVVTVKESYTGQYVKPVLVRIAASGRRAGGVLEGANKTGRRHEE